MWAFGENGPLNNHLNMKYKKNKETEKVGINLIIYPSGIKVYYFYGKCKMY